MKNKNPQRRCVGCREMKDKSSLIRITVNAEGEVISDNKAPGRGAYICRNNDCIQNAQKLKGLERSLKRSVPLEIYEKLVVSGQK
ncbi:MAG: YlxR family protein [Clostridiales bacterium]|jgi:predicted RNA-binding protein YlxR (DUF448 family)|nr:YlxR family protein [Clostridiales bacterium]